MLYYILQTHLYGKKYTSERQIAYFDSIFRAIFLFIAETKVNDASMLVYEKKQYEWKWIAFANASKADIINELIDEANTI